jgi:hypothetical protein
MNTPYLHQVRPLEVQCIGSGWEVVGHNERFNANETWGFLWRTMTAAWLLNAY